MISSATGNNKNLIDTCHFFFCPAKFSKFNSVRIFRYAPSHCITDRFWLFVNFFKHKMFKTAFFSSLCIPIYFKNLFTDWCSIYILYPDTFFSDSSNFTITHNKRTACLSNNSRYIGSNKIFAFTKSNNQRIIFFCANYFLRLFGTHKHQRIGSLNNTQNSFYSFFKVSIIICSH